MVEPRAIVFDLDGTLLDTSLDIAAACNETLQQEGFPTLSHERIVSFIGNGAKALIARASSIADDDPALPALVQKYIANYARTPCVHTTWMPHARRTLANLSDLALCLYTNKPRSVTLPLLEKLDTLSAFAVVVAGGDMPEPKPSAVGLEHIASKLGLYTTELVMVGDGPQDVRSGKAAGARTVAVSAGYTRAELLRQWQPDVLLDDMSKLTEVVEGWRNVGKERSER